MQNLWRQQIVWGRRHVDGSVKGDVVYFSIVGFKWNANGASTKNLHWIPSNTFHAGVAGCEFCEDFSIIHDEAVGTGIENIRDAIGVCNEAVRELLEFGVGFGRRSGSVQNDGFAGIRVCSDSCIDHSVHIVVLLVSVKRRASDDEGVIGARDDINAWGRGEGEEKEWQSEELLQRQGAMIGLHTLAIFESMLDLRPVPLNGNADGGQYRGVNDGIKDAD
jgi:hypothetical protein